MVVWLETEQQTFWNYQVRSRTEAVTAAKEKVRSKKLFKDSSGRAQSAVDEEKATDGGPAAAGKEKQQKLENTRKWARRLQRELHNYKGGVQPLATLVAVDIPTAVSTLDKLSGSLDKYVAAEPVTAGSTIEAAPAAAGGSAERGTRRCPAATPRPGSRSRRAAAGGIPAGRRPAGRPRHRGAGRRTHVHRVRDRRGGGASRRQPGRRGQCAVQLYDATGRVLKEIK